MKKLLFVILVGMAFAGTTMAAGDADIEKEMRLHMFYSGMFRGCISGMALASPALSASIVIRECKRAVVDREIIDGQSLSFRRLSDSIINETIEQMFSGQAKTTK